MRTGGRALVLVALAAGYVSMGPFGAIAANAPPAAPAGGRPAPHPPAPPAAPAMPATSSRPEAGGTSPALSEDAAARSRMHECGHQWSSMKKAGTAGTLTWKEFSATCLVVSK